jgi:hypothetical protein
MDYVWQRLAATALILGTVITLALTHVVAGEAALAIISLAAGLWFGQFIPTTLGSNRVIQESAAVLQPAPEVIPPVQTPQA